MQDLRAFIKLLEKQKKLICIKQQVSTQLEITEICDRLLKQNGPAVLFENVIAENGKSKMPVLGNLFGTIDRVALGLGLKDASELRSLGEYLAFLKQPEPPASVKEAYKMLPIAKRAMAMKPKKIKQAPCQEVVITGNDIDLTRLPIQTCWPNEPAPLITWPLVVTKGAGKDRTDSYNLGIYRMQVTGKNTTLMRWLKHRGGAQHYRGYDKNNKGVPAAAVIGCDPATILSAVTPVPDNVSEYAYAGLLTGKKLELVKCKTIPLEVPAHAEIVLEGYVSQTEFGDEGPYGDHTGYYNSVEQFPVFNITAITHRKKPIYHSTYTGKPPDECSVLGEALNEVFIPLLQQQFPEITDFYLPPEGCSYRIAVVSIKKSYAGHAKRIMMAVWSYLRQFTYTKWVIVTDDNVDIRDWKEVMWAISTKMDFGRDITIIENTPIDYLDFASPKSGLGAKLGFDATDKIGTETDREWGQEIRMDETVKKKVDTLLKDINL